LWVKSVLLTYSWEINPTHSGSALSWPWTQSPNSALAARIAAIRCKYVIWGRSNSQIVDKAAIWPVTALTRR